MTCLRRIEELAKRDVLRVTAGNFATLATPMMTRGEKTRIKGCWKRDGS